VSVVDIRIWMVRRDPTDGSVAAHPNILATNAPQQDNGRSPEENTTCAGRGFRHQSLLRLGRAGDNTSKDTRFTREWSQWNNRSQHHDSGTSQTQPTRRFATSCVLVQRTNFTTRPRRREQA
jgi:hypothetical protein